MISPAALVLAATSRTDVRGEAWAASFALTSAHPTTLDKPFRNNASFPICG
jgi:hypothetical protein